MHKLNYLRPIFAARTARALLAGALLLVLLAGLASAETWRGLDLSRRISESPWHLGPLRIQPAIIITNAGVDSNIYFAPTNPVRDFTLTAGPGVDAYLPLGRHIVISGYGSPQYVWYAKTAQERSWNFSYSGALALSFKDVFLSAGYARVEARERWNTEIDIRPRRTENDWAGAFLLKTSRRTSLEAAWTRNAYDYESLFVDDFNLRERLSRTESYYSLSAFYQSTIRTRWFLTGEYGNIRFAFADSAVLRNSNSEAAYAGIEFSPLGRIRGRIRVGYKTLDVLNTPAQDFRGLVGDSQIAVTLVRPFVVRAGYRRGVQYSFWFNNAYYVESVPSAGASIYVRRLVRFDYDYLLGRNRYPEAQDLGGGEIVKRRDNYRIHSAGVYFRVWKKSAIGFIVNWWKRTSNIPFENDKRLFYGANLTYDF